jgi:hypothetical protein
LHNVELVFDTAISHLQFLVHISYESCQIVLVIQTVGKIIDFLRSQACPRTNSSTFRHLLLQPVVLVALHRRSHPQKVKCGESPPFRTPA